MEKEVKLWEKYCKEIDKENEPIVKMWQENEEREEKKFRLEMKEYNRKIERYEENQKKDKKEHENWEKLPWYRKIFTEEPFHYGEDNYYPSLPSFPFSFPLSLRKPTHEDFMSWLVKNKKLL